MAGETVVLTLLAKDLASGNIQKVAAGLDGMKSKGSLAGTALKGAGVLASGGFALMTAGALQAEGAQGKFMAATGASREEAKQFVSGMDSLAGTAGAVGKSFEDIAATGTMVEQQFGTTGAKTTELTGHILEFAKVTGQDAAQAAGDLEDMLSAMGLTGDDAVSTMDRLVASSQKYGTDAGPAAVDALNGMAPALTAMGMGLGDGIELLNAFEVAGGNAGDATKGLKTAVAQLKPGQNIDDLITKIAAIEDPMLKNEAATEAFGKKMGPELAKIIKPGMTSLDDFGVSAEEAAGKTGKAADDMLTMGDRIRGFADKAMAGARELGQQFGPAITGMASLGTLAAPFAKNFGDLLKNVATRVLPQAVAAGAVTGAAIAEGEAEGAGGVSAIGKIGARIAAMSIPLAASGTTVGTAIGAAMAVAIPLAIAAAGASLLVAIPYVIEKLTGSDPASKWAAAGRQMADKFAEGYSEEAKNKYGSTFVQAYQAAIASGATENEAELAGKVAADAFLRGMSGTIVDHTADDAREAMGQSGITTIFANDTALKNAGITAAHTITGGFGEAIPAAWKHVAGIASKAAGDAGDDAADSFSQAVLSHRGDAQSAWTDFVNMMKHPLDTAAEIAELKGDLASKKMIKGLASNDPQTRQWAENTRDTIQNRINDLEKLLAEDGTAAGNALARAIRNRIQIAAGAASDLADAVNRQLAKIVTGIKVNIDVYGEQYGHGHGLPKFAEGGRYKGGTLAIVGDKGKPELFMSDQSGYIFPDAGRAISHGRSITSSGGDGIHLHFDFPSLVPYSGAQMRAAVEALMPELIREMRRNRLIPSGGSAG